MWFTLIYAGIVTNLLCSALHVYDYGFGITSPTDLHSTYIYKVRKGAKVDFRAELKISVCFVNL